MAYAAAAEMGLTIPFPPEINLSPFWPPAAVSLTMLLLFGAELFPAVFVADLAVSLVHHYSLKTSLAIAGGNTIEPLISVALIRWIGDFRPDLRRVRDVVALVLCGGLVGTTAGATFWVLLRNVIFSIPVSRQLHAGFMWMRSDLASILLLAPLLMVWSRPPASLLSPRRFAEAAIAFASLVAANALVFGRPESGSANVYAVEHLSVPFVIWLALRFDTRGATLGVYVTALMAARNTILGNGPFAREGLFGLHVFLAVLSVTALIIASTICEHRQVESILSQSEMQLTASEERYRDLFENAEDVIVTFDLNGRFTSANNSAVQITGYARAELLRMKLLDIVAPSSHKVALAEFREATEEKRQAPHRTYEVARKDGRTLWLEVNSRPLLKDGTPVGIQSIGRDITWRKRMEAELLQGQKMEAVGRLAGGVAHDFNNLLGVIIGYSDLILAEAPKGERLHQRLVEITKAAKRAADVTRQLLAFSRKQVLQTRVVDLNWVVHETARMLLRLLGEDIELVTKLTSSPVCVETDPSQMQQVLMNLAINARDAMPRGGQLAVETSIIELQPEAGLEIFEGLVERGVSVRPGEYVVLAVTDTGLGMDEKTKARIFEPFFTTKPLGEGTGLGLSTVFGFVKQSGGYIGISSEPGRGSTFKVYLPQIRSVERPVASEYELVLPRGTETVLLVEDEHSLRELNCELMRSLGYHVLEATHGAQACEIAAAYSGPIHLLLTDVVMPAVSGRELADRLAVTRPEIKVLYMSGYTDTVIVQHGILGAGIAFLQKPFTREELARKLRELLTRSPGTEPQLA